MPGFLGAGENHQSKTTVVADGAITGGLFVKYKSAPNVYEQAGVSGEVVDGVALWDIADGEAGTVNEEGPTEMTSGALVAAGALVMTNAAGKAITATTGEFAAGRAETATTGADEALIVNLFKSGHYVP